MLNSSNGRIYDKDLLQKAISEFGAELSKKWNRDVRKAKLLRLDKCEKESENSEKESP